MQQCNIPLQVLLCLLEDPLLEVNEIESMGIVDLLGLEPLDEEGEMIWYFFSIEDAVDHVAAEQSHLDLVTSVRVDLGVLVDRFKDVGCSRSI